MSSPSLSLPLAQCVCGRCFHSIVLSGDVLLIAEIVSSYFDLYQQFFASGNTLYMINTHNSELVSMN